MFTDYEDILAIEKPNKQTTKEILKSICLLPENKAVKLKICDRLVTTSITANGF